jgi:hypothetical protein
MANLISTQVSLYTKFVYNVNESIIVEHNDKEDDINLHISTIDDIAKAILLEIHVNTIAIHTYHTHNPKSQD